MKSICSFVFIFGLFLSKSFCDFYEDAAKNIFKAAIKNNIKVVAIISSNSKDNIVQEEVEYIVARLTEELHKQQEISIIDSYIASKIKRSYSPQAVIIVKVYETETVMKVIVKMISLENSILISAFSGEVKKELILPNFNLDNFSLTYSSEISFDSKKFFEDFRDSPRDSDKCFELKKKLISEQGKLNDIKAKYWSIKLKDGSFSYSSLRVNPGSEILDSFDKEEFYLKLKNYYYSGEKIVLKPEEIEKLNALFKKERDYIDKCGI